MVQPSQIQLPAGACDTHMHFYDRRFPTAACAVKQTPPDFLVTHYRSLMAQLGTERLVAVQPTTYGLDNRLQLEAAAAFGGQARVIVAIDETVSEETLHALHAKGVRGVRFFMWRGGSLSWESLLPTAARIAPFGWHIELHMDGMELADRHDLLRRLPCPVILDHLGRFSRPVDQDMPAKQVFDRLLDSGNWWVKLSAPGLQVGPDIQSRVEALLEQAPTRLVWASNCPHPGQSNPPDELRELEDWLRWIGDPQMIEQIFSRNPAQLYDFPNPGVAEPARASTSQQDVRT